MTDQARRHPLPLRFFRTAWDGYVRVEGESDGVPKFLVEALAESSTALLTFFEQCRQPDETVYTSAGEPVDFWAWAKGLSVPARRSQLRHGVDVGAWVTGSSPIGRLHQMARPVARLYKPITATPRAIDVMVELGYRLPCLPAMRALAIVAAVSADRLDVAMWLERDAALDHELRLGCVRDFISQGFGLHWMKTFVSRGGLTSCNISTLLLLGDAAELGTEAIRRSVIEIAYAQLVELAPHVTDYLPRTSQVLGEPVDAERLFATVFGMCWNAPEADYAALCTALSELKYPSAVDRCFEAVQGVVPTMPRDARRRALTTMLLHDDLKVRKFAGRVMAE